jgi:hypothetical protein
MLVFLLQVLV